MFTTFLLVAVGGLLVGLVLGGWASQRSEAAYRARLVTRGIAAGLAEHGITGPLSPRVVQVHQAPGGFEVDSIHPARVTVANHSH